jgi:4-hydroxy-3-methylbut-2-enyl diphosphate reductase
MEIEKAYELGFCFGVRRAIEIVQQAAQEQGPFQTLGPVVHNRQVVEELKAMGIGIAESLADIAGERIAIVTHGVAPSVLKELESRGLKIIDATCPIVSKAQLEAQRLAEAKLYVLIFGDSTHREVQGLLGWAGANATATLQVPQWQNFPRRIGVLSQTTQSQDSFARFLEQLIASAIASVSELRISNTICPATIKRQNAALELAGKVDLMVVVGGRDSANTRHLAQSCAAAGVTTYHIESAAELNPLWLEGRCRIGLTAGASTPDWVINEVAAKLKEMA